MRIDAEAKSVAAVGQSELFKIKFESPNPKTAATISNAVAEECLELHSDTSEKETQDIIKCQAVQGKGSAVSSPRIT